MKGTRSSAQRPKSVARLLVILVLLTVVSVSAVAWFGWRLMEQESVVAEQRAQERQEETADRVVTSLRGVLERRSVGWVFRVSGDSLTALPPARLLYRPFASTETEAANAVFAEGESLEFPQGQPASAVEWYRRLAPSRDAAVRAGACMRLGRVLRRLGREAESLEAYRKLAGIGGVRVAGDPAELVGLTALGDKNAVRAGLLSGRWALERAQFEFYWSKVSGDAAPQMEAGLERAAAVAWRERAREPASGQSTIWVDDLPLYLNWRTEAGRREILVASPPAVLAAGYGGEAPVAAVDEHGRVVAGRKEGAGRLAVRTAADSNLPWTLYVGRGRGAQDAEMAAGRRYLLLAMSVMVVFLIAGTYFIARAIRREAAVARLQSDFVAAVSHEFRTPLTSIRQLSEMLALGRVAGDGRRQRYYETLVGETGRLQRLVEKLLNFGGMEAGKRQYHFEPVESAPLVERVAKEFEGEIAGSGRLIELQGASDGCRIEADREALSIALRNLVDNALKYSPDCPTVWVEWGRAEESVEIRVRDRGPGIPAAERREIFGRFVRGSAASSAGVKGMGVGLAMVQHIVAAHGGEVRVASEPGEGSTFTMVLPAAKE